MSKFPDLVDNGLRQIIMNIKQDVEALGAECTVKKRDEGYVMVGRKDGPDGWHQAILVSWSEEKEQAVCQRIDPAQLPYLVLI